MKQAVLSGPRSFEFADIEQPEAGPGQVLVRVRNVGVCGTDVHFYRGELPMTPGTCLGHEISGEVAALGAGVTRVAAGDRVAIEPFTVCGVCDSCRAGRYNLCASMKSSGLSAPGGLREYMAMPAYSLYKLPEAVDFELGALVEPLAVTVHGLKLCDMVYGERVGILGAGTIGLLALVAAKETGASYVAISARHPHQRTMAEALGADAVFSDEPDGISAMRGALRGADVMIETVGGKADTLGTAVNLLGVRGRVCMLGVFSGPVTFNPIMLLLREGRIVGSNCYTRSGTRSDYDIAIEIMARNAGALRGLITHRFPLAHVATAYATADDKKSGAIKVTVTP